VQIVEWLKTYPSGLFYGNFLVASLKLYTKHFLCFR
jgi:hypothetical protein